MSDMISQKNEEINLVLCPSCRKTIPFIKVAMSNEKGIVLLIQCKCTFQINTIELGEYLQSLKQFNKAEQHNCSNHVTINSRKYCSICQKWMCQDCLITHNESEPDHILLNKEIDISGVKFRIRFQIGGCIDCRKGMCRACLNHQSHLPTKLNVSKVKEFITSFKRIGEIMKQNQSFRDNFNQWCDETNSNNWRSSVNKAYDNNRLINLQLKQLCDSILQTVAVIGDYSNSLFNLTFTTLKVNTKSTEVQIASNELERSYTVLIKYFTTEYILLTDNDTLGLEPTNIHTYQCLKDDVIQDGWFAFFQLKDGRFFSSDDKNSVTFRDSSTFEFIQSFKPQLSIFYSFIQLQDGRLVSDFGDNKIMLWDLATFKSLGTFKGHSVCIRSLLQLQDGRLVSGGSDKMIKLWNISTLECLSSVKTNAYKISSLAQLSDGRLVSGADNMIQVWNTHSFKCLYSFLAHFHKVNSLFQLDNGILVSGGDDKVIKMWNMFSFECIRSILTHFVCVRSLFQLRNGLLVSLSTYNTVFDKDCSFSSSVQIWDV